jgi:hypothetical protein
VIDPMWEPWFRALSAAGFRVLAVPWPEIPLIIAAHMPRWATRL